jgi:hypothetical protein
MNDQHEDGLAAILLPSYRTRFRKLKVLGDGALEQLAPEDWHRITGAADNSMAVIVQHITGNMRSRWTDFLSSDGEKPNRHRDREFVEHPELLPEELQILWNQGWSLLLNTLDALDDSDLVKTVTIRQQPLSVVDAINRQLGHYNYHVGQMVYVARMFKGDAWRSLSIPRGDSAIYQAKPDD